ncbi:hypothetical protein AAE478_006168 [Parahypoxylon ruwenzoriense]
MEDCDTLKKPNKMLILLASQVPTKSVPVSHAGYVFPKYSQCLSSGGQNIAKTQTDILDTWVYFEIKHLDDKPRFQDELRYRWHKINTFTRLIASTQQTIVIVFDAQPPIVGCILSPLLEPDLKASVDPFWVYSRLAGEVVRLEDSAVWAIRNHVRAIETERKPPGKPQPDYRRLHDIARHAIHVSETLDVAVETMDGILAQHDDFLGLDFPVTPPPKRGASNNTRRHLLFCKKMLRSLRHRANSNKERLQNEIQLAFNTVAQYDAGTSVEIGRASQIDSAAMKTIAFLTMAFLPATFFSAIFSMSFFDYDADSDLWRVSSKFWVYWAFAIPATLATFTLWYFWHRAFPPTSPGT